MAVKRKVVEFHQQQMQLQFLLHLRRFAKGKLARRQTNEELDQFCGNKKKQVILDSLKVAVSCRVLESSIAEDMEAFHRIRQYKKCLRLFTLLVMRRWTEKERLRISSESNKLRTYRLFLRQLEANTIYGAK